MPIVSSFVSRIPNMSSIFMYNNEKCKKLRFKKWHHPFLVISHSLTKNKDIALKLCMYVVGMYVESMYSVFYILRMLNCFFFLKNQNFEFGGQIRKILKGWDNHFVEHLIFAIWRYSIASYLKTFWQPSNICRFSTQNDETWKKNIFFQKFSDKFYWNLVTDVKLMLGKVLKS